MQGDILSDMIMAGGNGNYTLVPSCSELFRVVPRTSGLIRCEDRGLARVGCGVELVERR